MRTWYVGMNFPFSFLFPLNDQLCTAVTTVMLHSVWRIIFFFLLYDCLFHSLVSFFKFSRLRSGNELMGMTFLSCSI